MRAARQLGIIAAVLLCVVGTIRPSQAGYIFTTIDDPDARPGGTSPMAINNAGDVVGNYTDKAGVSHGFLYTGGKYATLDVPGAFSGTTILTSISNSGAVAGTYTSSSGNPAFVESGGVFTPLDGAGPGRARRTSKLMA